MVVVYLRLARRLYGSYGLATLHLSYRTLHALEAAVAGISTRQRGACLELVLGECLDWLRRLPCYAALQRWPLGNGRVRDWRLHKMRRYQANESFQLIVPFKCLVSFGLWRQLLIEDRSQNLFEDFILRFCVIQQCYR